LKPTETTGPYFANAVGRHGAILRHKFRDIYVPVEIDTDTNEVLRDPKTGFAKRKSYEEGGEILVNIPSESAFAGYWRNPEATGKMFERNVFKKGDLFYRTGDALRRTPDGRWFFLDRLGDTFRWKSENVSTAEVAECLGNFPGVVEANVYGVEVPGRFLFRLSAPPISFTSLSLINTTISSLVHVNRLLFQSIHLLFFYIYLLPIIYLLFIPTH
jgi:acyl-CoA synthetase (AMP-forming)/AMP-acid ligase II